MPSDIPPLAPPLATLPAKDNPFSTALLATSLPTVFPNSSDTAC